MRLSDYKNNKLVIENLTDKKIIIGDLNIKLSPRGLNGSSQDVFAYDDLLGIQRRSFEQISKSRQLQSLIVSGFVQLSNENGVISGIDNQIKEVEYLLKSVVKADIVSAKADIVSDISVDISTAISQIPVVQIPDKLSVDFLIDSSQSLTSSSTSTIGFVSKVGDTSDSFDISDDKIVFNQSGKYNISYNFPIEGNGLGLRSSWISKNGTAPPYVSPKAFMSLKANSDKGVTTATYWLERKRGTTIAHMNSPVNGWTVEFFYKPISFGTATGASFDGTIVYIAGSSDNDSLTTNDVTSMFPIMQFSDGRIGYGGSFSVTGRWSPVLELNKWYHLAITCSGTNTKVLKLYINGELASSNANTSVFELTRASINNQYNTGIGVRVGNGLHKFQIQDFRISTNVRYTDNFTVPSDRLAADGSTYCLYPMNDKIGEYAKVVRSSTTSNTFDDGEKTFVIDSVLPDYVVVNDYVTCLSATSNRILYGKIKSISGTTIVIDGFVRNYTAAAKTDWTLIFCPRIRDLSSNGLDMHFLSGKEGTLQNMLDYLPDFEFAQGYIPSSYQNSGDKHALVVTSPFSDGNAVIMSGSCVLNIVDGDYIELVGYQNSGSGLGLSAPLIAPKLRIDSM